MLLRSDHDRCLQSHFAVTVFSRPAGKEYMGREENPYLQLVEAEEHDQTKRERTNTLGERPGRSDSDASAIKHNLQVRGSEGPWWGWLSSSVKYRQCGFTLKRLGE